MPDISISYGQSAQIIAFPHGRTRAPKPERCTPVRYLVRPDGVPVRPGDRVQVAMINGALKNGIITDNGAVLDGIQTYSVMCDDGIVRITRADWMFCAGYGCEAPTNNPGGSAA